MKILLQKREITRKTPTKKHRKQKQYQNKRQKDYGVICHDHKIIHRQNRRTLLPKAYTDKTAYDTMGKSSIKYDKTPCKL